MPLLESTDAEIGLHNPYSNVSCFIVYLYSMEFGSPPLYTEINRVARKLDLSLLKQLGPFIKALHITTYNAERQKNSDDKIGTGEMLGGAWFNIGGAFLLWRGALMKEEWIF